MLNQVEVPYIFMEWNKMFFARHGPLSPCPARAIETMVANLVKRGFTAHEVRTGFELDPDRCVTKWRVGDVYWRQSQARKLQDPF